MPIKSFIFDLDGTLVDAFPAHVEAFRQAFKETGHPFDERLVAIYYGQTGVEIIRRILNKPAIDNECYDLMARKNGHFQKLATGNVTALPCSTELLESLQKRKIKIALATSAVRSGALLCLKSASLNRFFRTIVTGEDIKRSKPDPEIFLKAAGLLKTKPEECAVVEDSLHGINAAKAAGMRSIAVATGTTKRSDLESLKPDIMIDTLCELENSLDSFLARI